MLALFLEEKKPLLACLIAWLMVSTKSGNTRVCASIRPNPPCAIAIYAMRRESGERESLHVSLERKPSTIWSIPTERGPCHSSHLSHAVS